MKTINVIQFTSVGRRLAFCGLFLWLTSEIAKPPFRIEDVIGAFLFAGLAVVSFASAVWLAWLKLETLFPRKRTTS
jgi:hypothetical protein